MTYFKDDEGNLYLQYRGPSPKYIQHMKRLHGLYKAQRSVERAGTEDVFAVDECATGSTESSQETGEVA